MKTWQEKKPYTLRGYRAGRLLLIKDMGGKCIDCGEDDPDELQFDHKFERTWKASKVSRWVRLARYKREANEGIIELRCQTCNKKKGKPMAVRPKMSSEPCPICRKPMKLINPTEPEQLDSWECPWHNWQEIQTFLEESGDQEASF